MVFQSAIACPVSPDGVCIYTAFTLNKILYCFLAFFMIFGLLGRQNGRQNNQSSVNHENYSLYESLSEIV